ncbi:hypothetical protein [Mesorhizobium sp.]|uniref:hypothetical protein n=1 Tax=Mesorhizobium sp. TaxID=1871066 RepID=UPI000FE60CB5|nr:hypothetical protein [Mesorhizobium sp.]RWE44217.1 MAG: hypothetical protein EOS80_19955 [Mesorhizobium sp.]
MTTQGMSAFGDIMRTAQKRSDDRRWKEQVNELVALIDQLATDRSPAALVEAVRLRGYNIEADTGMLERRGVNIN